MQFFGSVISNFSRSQGFAHYTKTASGNVYTDRDGQGHLEATYHLEY